MLNDTNATARVGEGNAKNSKCARRPKSGVQVIVNIGSVKLELFGTPPEIQDLLIDVNHPLTRHLLHLELYKEANYRSTMRTIKIKNIEELKAEVRNPTSNMEELHANIKKVHEAVERLSQFVENRPGKLFPETKRSR